MRGRSESSTKSDRAIFDADAEDANFLLARAKRIPEKIPLVPCWPYFRVRDLDADIEIHQRKARSGIVIERQRQVVADAMVGFEQELIDNFLCIFVLVE